MVAAMIVQTATSKNAAVHTPRASLVHSTPYAESSLHVECAVFDAASDDDYDE